MTWLRKAWVWLFGGACSCANAASPVPAPAADPVPERPALPMRITDKDLRQAALDVLFPRLGSSPSRYDIHWGKDGVWLDRWQVRVDELRAWAETIEDARVRAAYVHWLDYYDHKIREARDEIETRSLRADDERRRANDAQETQRRRLVRDAVRLPVPPREMPR